LKSQGLSIANQIGTTLEAFFPAIPQKVILAASTDDLLHGLAVCSNEHKSFTTILVIAHSNQQGLHLTSDHEATWLTFVNWISFFAPRSLIFAACQAGRPWPVKLLFDGLPSLDEIYAPPFIATRKQAEIIKLLLPVVALGKGRGTRIDQLIRALGFMATQSVIFRWTRRDFRRGAIDPQTWDSLLNMAKHIGGF